MPNLYRNNAIILPRIISSFVFEVMFLLVIIKVPMSMVFFTKNILKFVFYSRLSHSIISLVLGDFYLIGLKLIGNNDVVHGSVYLDTTY